MAEDMLGQVVPWILLLIGIIWLWSTFREPVGRFFAWLKEITGAGKDKFKDRFTPREYVNRGFVYE